MLRNGKFIKEVMTKDTPRDELIGMMIGKSADELSQIGAKKAHRDVTEGEQPIVSVKQLGLKGTINPTDLDIYPGQVVGFAGLLGSGRTELGRLLYGADKPDSGTYELKGKKTSISDPYTALRNKIAYSTENRRDERHYWRSDGPREHSDRLAGDERHVQADSEEGSRRDRRQVHEGAERSSERSEQAHQEPVRRQPAEGADRTLAGHASRPAHSGRADARHRYRRQGGNPAGGA